MQHNHFSQKHKVYLRKVTTVHENNSFYSNEGISFHTNSFLMPQLILFKKHTDDLNKTRTFHNKSSFSLTEHIFEKLTHITGVTSRSCGVGWGAGSDACHCSRLPKLVFVLRAPLIFIFRCVPFKRNCISGSQNSNYAFRSFGMPTWPSCTDHKHIRKRILWLTWK